MRVDEMKQRALAEAMETGRNSGSFSMLNFGQTVELRCTCSDLVRFHFSIHFHPNGSWLSQVSDEMARGFLYALAAPKTHPKEELVNV